MVTIRQLRREDGFDDLIALSRAFFQEYETHHEDFFKIDKLQDTDIVNYFSKTLDSNTAATFVAVQDERIVGYITVFVKSQANYWRVKTVGDISGLMVQKNYRQQGIGSKLLAEATAYFRARDVPYFTVYTAAANRSAIAFYEENGMNPLYITLLGETNPQPADAQ